MLEHWPQGRLYSDSLIMQKLQCDFSRSLSEILIVFYYIQNQLPFFSGVYKTTKIHFFYHPPPSKIIFLSQLRHLVAAQWDTIYGGSCGIQHLVAAVGYKFTKKQKNRKK